MLCLKYTGDDITIGSDDNKYLIIIMIVLLSIKTKDARYDVLTRKHIDTYNK